MLELYEETSADKSVINQRKIKQLQDTLRSYQNHVTSVETELEQKTKQLTMALSNIKAVSWFLDIIYFVYLFFVWS